MQAYVLNAVSSEEYSSESASEDEKDEARRVFGVEDGSSRAAPMVGRRTSSPVCVQMDVLAPTAHALSRRPPPSPQDDLLL